MKVKVSDPKHQSYFLDTDKLMCPACGEDMWDNRKTKKGKQPDFRCKKCELAFWISKEQPQPQQEQPFQKSTSDISHPEMMVLSYAKDIVVARIKKGEEFKIKGYLENIFHDMMKLVKLEKEDAKVEEFEEEEYQ